MHNILTLNGISPVFRDVLPAAEYHVAPDAPAPQAIIVRSADMHALPVPDTLLAVGRAGAGYNNIPVEDYARRGIVVFNTPGANANAVKELVVAGLLLGSRDIIGGTKWVDGLKGQGAQVGKLVEKGKGQFVGPELAGKTLGVIGLGAIGGPVANAAVALEMRVIGFDPYISVDHAWKLSRAIEHAKGQDEVLSQSDYLTVHIPLIQETAGSLNADFFARMKRGAVLLNFSRGELANTGDLLAALASGQLRGYVTDFPSEELIGVKGVVTIPHLGASTPESEDNCVRMVSRQIRQYLTLGSIVNSVNYPNCELEPNFKNRVAVMHKNVPNMVGAITAAVSAYGLNIDNMVNKSRGQFAYTALDLDDPAPATLLADIRALDHVFRVRAL